MNPSPIQKDYWLDGKDPKHFLYQVHSSTEAYVNSSINTRIYQMGDRHDMETFFTHIS